MKNILIADDHPLVIQPLKQLISEILPNATIYTIASWKELELDFRRCVNLFILDLEMPDGNAVDKILEINRKCPKSKIIVFTSHCQSWVFNGLAKCNINAFVSKLSDPSELIEAIKTLNEDEPFMCSEFRRVYFNCKEKLLAVDHLTLREQEILALVLNAKSTKEIAHELNISVNTVETHRKNLFVKFEVKNVVGLVNKATVFGNSKRVL